MQRQLLQLRDRRVQLLDIFFHREGNRVNLLTRVVKRARPLRELRQPVQLLRRGVDGVTDARGSLVEHRFHLRRLVREMQRRASSFVVVVEIVVIQRRPELLLLLFLHVRGGGGGVKIRAFSFRRGAARRRFRFFPHCYSCVYFRAIVCSLFPRSRKTLASDRYLHPGCSSKRTRRTRRRRTRLAFDA